MLSLIKGKLKLMAISAGALVAVTAAIYVFSTKSEALDGEFDPIFKAYISAYTGGYISKESPVQIRFVSETATEDMLGKPLDVEVFKFSPAIEGTTYWVDKSTLQFQPSKPLQSGQHYNALFRIGKILDMPKELKELNFGFQTLEQNLSVFIEGMQSYDKSDLKKIRLTGTLATFDVANNVDVEKVLTAHQGSKQLDISWEHEGDRKTHGFTIENVERKDSKETVLLKWDGLAIGSDAKNELVYEIPPLGDFKLISANAIQGEEQYAELQFSDPLDDRQKLDGLISIGNLRDVRIVVQDNIVKVYPPVRQTGLRTVRIDQSVKNVNGKKIGETISRDINFEELKPQVKISGKGVILPSTEGLNFPFEAVSLRSVRVRITRIYESNVIQFFQVNNFSGTSELKRVGKLVYNRSVPLTNNNPMDYARWKNYYLDLSSLINTEPGAIYQVKLSFSKKDIYYTCGDETLEADLVENDKDDDDFSANENSYWDYYDDYYYYEDHSYSERENPCSNSYYGDYRSVKRNIFASDLGIIAKSGTSGSMSFIVTDIKTTLPIANAEVNIYDYSQQIIKQVNTNSDGVASVSITQKPFFVAVKKDNQFGYLKLENSLALSVSNFDVSGVKIQKGIKGFMYGERGVWRPGDSLYLTFILEDKLKQLPDNQPVIFELTNPMGQVAKRMVATKSVQGFYNFSTNTSEDDPTGTYMANLKVGGASFSYPVKIETIVPNRLKINLDFGVSKLSTNNNKLDGNMQVKWLHGAVARNLNTDVSMTLNKAETKFAKYEEFTFDDPAKSFSSENIEVFRGKLNGDGEVRVKTSINAEGNAPGMLNASFKVRVHEEGGGFSVDNFTIPYYPYQAFTGIRVPQGDKARNMLLTDTNHVVDIVCLDPEGKLLGDREIEIQLYKMNWKWWWDKTEDNLSVYLNNSYRQPIQTHTIKTQNGKAKWNLRINYPEWGRYYLRMVDTKSKHSTGKIIFADWPGWAGKSQERMQGNASMLAFTADKDGYKVGEKITLNIPGNSSGRALVSIESGSKILETHWVETGNGKNNFTFTASEEMAPTAYINVTLLQPHAQTRNDLPIRMYGIIPVKVENPNTILKPVLTMKDELRPEENVTVSIKEENGKPMVYTIAVVDEGLLDLTRFKTLDPWNTFYAREALGVNTWDMYEYVIGAHGEKIERLVSLGGDDEANKKDGTKTNRFKPVVKYFGPFQLAAGKTANHSFTMPMYVGSVKTMVVAGTPEGAYGKTEKVTPVRKPLMVLATLPRVLGPEEQVALPVNIFAMTPNVKNVTLEVKTNNMLKLTEGSKKNVSFSRPGDEIVYFHMQAQSSTGKGKITVIATSGNEKAEHEIEIEIRNPNQAITKVFEEVIQPGADWTASYTAFGVAGSNSGILEVSNIPPINLESRLRYLMQYPYGCVEQTTSSVFPQLFVHDLAETPEELKKKSEANIKAGIDRLRSFQQPDGGLSYWPGNDNYDAWCTSYAGHFMLEAEKKGYVVPAGFMASWKKHQKTQARNYAKSADRSDMIQAYRLYTLALAKDPEMGAMNRLRESSNLSLAAKWRLAGAYHMAGYTDIARQLVTGANASIKDYKEMEYTFGSAIRDKAMIMEVMSMLGMKTDAANVLKDLSEHLSSNKWMSTQETAFCLMAISHYAGNSLPSSELKFTFALNNQKAIQAATARKISQVKIDVAQQNSGKVTVKNTSSGPLYTRVLITGVPAHGMEESSENNLKLQVSYKLKSGKSIDPSSLEQGTDFIAEVSITNPGNRGEYKNMALKQIFPSGWEIHNVRMYGDEGLSSDIPTYQDYRDDRVYTFFNVKPGQTKRFQVLLNASYLGKFYLPGLYAEAMYDGGINATIKGQWVEVVKKGMVALTMNDVEESATE
ncbi:MAG: alpha-2-macroglobulin family protein [Cytophagaceae bacterium]